MPSRRCSFSCGLSGVAALTFLLALAACGGGGGAGQPAPGPATVSTLAYVVTECRGDADGGTIRQALQIRRGEQAPITVVEHAAALPAVTIPGSTVQAIFQITGAEVSVVLLTLPGELANHPDQQFDSGGVCHRP